MSRVNFEELVPPEIFDYRKSPGQYAFKTAIHAGMGLAIGAGIDKACRKIQQGYNLRPSVMIFIQLVVLTVVFYIIEVYLVKGLKLVVEVQNITPGIFFAGLLFGSQINLFENVKKLIEPL